MVRAAEAFTAIGYKHIEAGRNLLFVYNGIGLSNTIGVNRRQAIPLQLHLLVVIFLCQSGTKLSEDCSRYGAENINDKILAKGASIYGDARKHVEKEQEDLNKLLSSQVDF